MLCFKAAGWLSRKYQRHLSDGRANIELPCDACNFAHDSGTSLKDLFQETKALHTNLAEPIHWHGSEISLVARGDARTPTHAKPSRVTIAQFQIPPSQQRCGCGLGCWIPPQSEHSCQGYTQSNCPSARWTTSSQCEPVCTATEPGSSSIDHPAIQASPARSQQWCSNPAPAILLFAWHYPGKSASAHVKKTVLVVLSFYIHMWIACHSA